MMQFSAKLSSKERTTVMTRLCSTLVVFWSDKIEFLTKSGRCFLVLCLPNNNRRFRQNSMNEKEIGKSVHFKGTFSQKQARQTPNDLIFILCAGVRSRKCHSSMFQVNEALPEFYLDN